MKMQERMKIRSVSFSDEAQPPALPARNPKRSHNIFQRRHPSAESLPVLEACNSSSANGEPLYGFVTRMNSLPRLGSRAGRQKNILDTYRWTWTQSQCFKSE